MSQTRHFRGIIPPLITPLLAPDVLDIAGLDRLVDRQLDGGVHGIFVLGTTGEGPSLSYDLRRELVRRVVERVQSRIPVLVGVTDTAYSETLRMSAFAANIGASAIVLAPPYYFQTSQADLLRLVEGLAQASAIPLFLYNMPGMTKVVFEPETVARAAKIPNVIGLKDSSRDMNYLKRVLTLMKSRPDFTILLGPEQLLMEGMKLGVHGGVHGGANIIPRLYVDLYQACLDGDETRARQLHDLVIALGEAVFDKNDHEYRYIRGIKCALSVLGICTDMPAWPYQPAGSELRQSIQNHLSRFAPIQT